MRPKIVLGLPPKQKYGKVAVDLEIFQANANQLHRPSGKFACMTIASGTTVYVITNEADVEQALQRVSKARWVIQNASFDIPHLRRWADIPDRPVDLFWDTLLIERLLWGGWYDDFDLGSMARRYLSLPMSKDVRKEFYKADALTDEMIRYSALDALATLKISDKQEPFLEKDPPSKRVWEWIDAPCFWALLSLRGFTLNTKKWDKLADYFEKEAERVKNDLGFNPGSPQQTVKVLESRGLNLTDRRTRRKTTNEAMLEKYKGDPIVDQILEYRGAKKLASTYGRNFLSYVEADGKIYTNVSVNRAITGRTASGDPNLQNLPSLKSFRECFEPESGYDLIITDYGSQEPKLSAALSGDKALIEIFQRNLNLYVEVGKRIYGDPNLKYKGKDDPRRRLAKAIALGTNYGLQAKGLSERTKVPLWEAESILSEYFIQFSGVKRWIDETRKVARENEYVRTPDGRRVWINPYSWGWMNLAINAPIQGGAAAMTKRALIEIYEDTGREKYPVIVPVHDEIVAEAKKTQSKRVAKLIEKAMAKAHYDIIGKTVPPEAEAIIGKNWGAKE